MDYSNYVIIDSTNRNNKENLGLKTKYETMSFPLSGLKLDNEFNNASLKTFPTLKVESAAKLKPHLSRDFESTFCPEVNTSSGEEDPLAEVKESISTEASSGSKYPNLAYQTVSTASASRELKPNYLNPAVVLNRLCFPWIGSIQAKEDSINRTRERDAQNLQTHRYDSLFPIRMEFQLFRVVIQLLIQYS